MIARRGRVVTFVVLMALHASPRARASNGVELIGNTLPAKARGEADIPLGDSVLSQLDTPATLSRHGRAFDSVLESILPRNEWTSPLDHANTEYGIVPLLNLGEAIPLDDRWTLGWAFQSKSGLVSGFHIRHLPRPDVRLGERADLLNACFPLHLSDQVNEKLSIGVGVRAEFVTDKFHITFGPLFADFERAYAMGGGFQCGALYQATPRLSLGVGYRSPTWMGDLEGGHTRVSFFNDPTTRLDLGPGKASRDLPQKLNLGFAWEAAPSLTWAAEVRWIHYADSLFHRLELQSSGLPGILPARFPLEIGYRDPYVVAIGIDLRLTYQWTLGAGYNYGTDLVPPEHLLPTASILAKHHVSMGLRYDRQQWWAGVGYILAVSTGLESGPVNAFPAPNDFASSHLGQTQHSIVVGVGFRR